MTGLTAFLVLLAAIAVAWPGLTALRLLSARVLGGDPGWWRCALLLDRPGSPPDLNDSPFIPTEEVGSA